MQVNRIMRVAICLGILLSLVVVGFVWKNRENKVVINPGAKKDEFVSYKEDAQKIKKQRPFAAILVEYINEPNEIIADYFFSSATWTYVNIDSSPEYSESYSIGYCNIYVRKRDNGITISVYDKEDCKYQNINIVNGVKEERYAGYHDHIFIPCVHTPDYFFVDYLKYAKSLPDSVKKRFGQYYSLN